MTAAGAGFFGSQCSSALGVVIAPGGGFCESPSVGAAAFSFAVPDPLAEYRMNELWSAAPLSPFAICDWTRGHVPVPCHQELSVLCMPVMIELHFVLLVGHTIRKIRSCQGKT